MQEILGQNLRASFAGEVTSTTTRRNKDRELDTKNNTRSSERTRTSTVRDPMVLSEHNSTLRLGASSSKQVALSDEDHGTLYKQHYSGLEVNRLYMWC